MTKTISERKFTNGMRVRVVLPKESLDPRFPEIKFSEVGKRLLGKVLTVDETWITGLTIRAEGKRRRWYAFPGEGYYGIWEEELEPVRELTDDPELKEAFI